MCSFLLFNFFACNVHTGNVSCLSTTQYGCGTKEAMLSGEKVIFLKRNTWLWALFNKSTSQFFMVCTLITRHNVQNSSGTTSRWRVVSLQRVFFTVTSAVLTSISVKVTRRIAGQNRAREKEKNKWRHYHVISMVFSRI